MGEVINGDLSIRAVADTSRMGLPDMIKAEDAQTPQWEAVELPIDVIRTHPMLPVPQIVAARGTSMTTRPP